MRMLSKTSRIALMAAATMSLSGCLTHDSLTEDAFAPEATQMPPETQLAAESAFGAPTPPDSVMNYAAVDDNGHHLVEIPVDKVDPRFLRQRVPYNAQGYEVGTVIVDTPNRFLYVVEANGMAMRYGVAVGGSGLSWKGEAKVGTKREWPSWHPPAEMIKRKPELEPYKNGMPPGLTNPLGARALYLYADGKDTLYRLHGTAEWWTIGTAASSGCIRLMNQDAIDLYNRIPVGAKVVVLQGNEALVGENDDDLPQYVASNTGATGMGAPMEGGGVGGMPSQSYPAQSQSYPAQQQPYGNGQAGYPQQLYPAQGGGASGGYPAAQGGYGSSQGGYGAQSYVDSRETGSTMPAVDAYPTREADPLDPYFPSVAQQY